MDNLMEQRDLQSQGPLCGGRSIDNEDRSSPLYVSGKPSGCKEHPTTSAYS